MPAYNAEKTLLKTHSEVLSQNIVDLVIIVDDGSTDDTQDWLVKINQDFGWSISSLSSNQGKAIPTFCQSWKKGSRLACF